jgi:hypothetical protein
MRYEEEARLSFISSTTGVRDPTRRRGSGAARFTGITVEDAKGAVRYDFEIGEVARLRLQYRVFQEVRNLYAGFVLRGGISNDAVTSASHLVTGQAVPANTTGEIIIDIDTQSMRPGTYPLYFWMGDHFSVAYDTVDELTAPLVIATTRSFEELGYDPTVPSGFYSVQSRLVRT